MSVYATTIDVEDRLGRPVTNPVQVQAWLDDVEVLIRARIPNIADLVATGQVDADTLRMVEANAVIRRLQNPEGLSTYTVRVDDGSVTKTRSGSSTDGVLALTDDEWELLLPRFATEAASVRYAYEPGWRQHAGSRWGCP